MAALPSPLQRLLPSRNARSYLYLAVAVVLLLNPLYLAGWGLDPVYRYEAAEVSYAAGDGFEFRPVGDGDYPADHEFRVEGVLCTGSERRTCALARGVYENRTTNVSGFPDFRYYRYALFDGRVYEPVSRADGRFVLGYERTDGSEALDHLARLNDEPQSAVRTAITTGAVVTHEKQPANRLYEHDGSYYLLYRTYSGPGVGCDDGGYDQAAADGVCAYRGQEHLLAAGVTLAGLLLLWRSKKLAATG